MGERLSSIEVEQAVLGAAMIDPVAFAVAEQAGLREAHFADPAHQRLYKGMAQLSARDMGLDYITLTEQLGSSGELEAVGGDSYLVTLVENTPSAANCESYARIVIERAQQRRWLMVLEQARGLFMDPACSDPVGAAEALLAQLESKGAGAAFVTLREALKEEVDRIQDQFENPGIRGLQTGYSNIDHRLQGMQPGDLIVVAARPSMGKTAYALNVVRQAAKQRQAGSVLVYSLEMRTGSLVQRMVAAEGKVKKDLLRSAKVFDHDDSTSRMMGAMQRLANLDVKLCDSPGLTVSQIRSMALAERRRSGVRFVAIDYLGLIDFEGKDQSRANQVGDITRTLKKLARELECPVMILSQLNRDVEKRTNKRPLMSDLRDSGAIEQDADVIQFLYRDEYYNENTQYPGQVEIITGKCREGETGPDYLTWQGQYQLMESNSTRDIEPPDGAGGGFYE